MNIENHLFFKPVLYFLNITITITTVYSDNQGTPLDYSTQNLCYCSWEEKQQISLSLIWYPPSAVHRIDASANSKFQSTNFLVKVRRIVFCSILATAKILEQKEGHSTFTHKVYCIANNTKEKNCHVTQSPQLSLPHPPSQPHQALF